MFAGCIEHLERAANLELAHIIAFQVGQRNLPVLHPLISEDLKGRCLDPVARVQDPILCFRRIETMSNNGNGSRICWTNLISLQLPLLAEFPSMRPVSC